MDISKYSSTDKSEIINLFTRVFTDSEGESEGALIGKLVLNLMDNSAEEELYGFVVKENNKTIGCIFFSLLTFEIDITAFILSPVAIHTDFQKQGLGQKLINYGISYLKDMDVELVFTYGDPEFYGKVGFKTISEDIAKAPFKLTYPFGWLCQSLVDRDIEPIEGNSHCVPALNNPQYW